MHEILATRRKATFNQSTNLSKRNSKTPKVQTEIVKLEDRQGHGQQNETKDKYRTHLYTEKELRLI